MQLFAFIPGSDRAVYRNVPLSFKPGGLSILTQCTPSLRDALAPAKDHDAQQQLGHRVTHQP